MSAPDALKAWRESQTPWLSQADAAAKAGVSAATWCDWEKGNKSPAVDRAADLERVTDGAVTVAMWAEFTRDRRAERAEAKEGEHRPE